MIAEVQHAGRVTYAAVRVASDSHLAKVGLGDLIGRGEARCSPKDIPSEKVGELVALGRAMQDLGRQVEEAGIARATTWEQFREVLATFTNALVENLKGL